jgi:hypothetical protein
MAETPNHRAKVVPIGSYLPVSQSEPQEGQLTLFETSPASKLVDRTRRPLTREGIEHRQRMLTFLTRAR